MKTKRCMENWKSCDRPLPSAFQVNLLSVFRCEAFGLPGTCLHNFLSILEPHDTKTILFVFKLSTKQVEKASDFSRSRFWSDTKVSPLTVGTNGMALSGTWWSIKCFTWLHLLAIKPDPRRYPEQFRVQQVIHLESHRRIRNMEGHGTIPARKERNHKSKPVIKRLMANKCERERVRKINEAFEVLKTHIPYCDSGRIRTKLDVLKFAIDYIQILSKMVSQNEAAMLLKASQLNKGGQGFDSVDLSPIKSDEIYGVEQFTFPFNEHQSLTVSFISWLINYK